MSQAKQGQQWLVFGWKPTKKPTKEVVIQKQTMANHLRTSLPANVSWLQLDSTFHHGYLQTIIGRIKYRFAPHSLLWFVLDNGREPKSMVHRLFS